MSKKNQSKPRINDTAPMFGLSFGKSCDHRRLHFYSRTQEDGAVVKCKKCNKRLKRGDTINHAGHVMEIKYVPRLEKDGGEQ